jgi:murein DD-endopeptidase MepM/ murein hydrolase activator NlpD
MMQRRWAAVAAAFALLPWAQPGAAQEPKFDSPVACPATYGCVVRNFVDMDPTPEARDQNCGNITYDGHKGIDIRVPDSNSLVRGVEVFAAARGTVLRLRDNMPDVSIRETGADAVKDREAGNSIIIDHGNGWETQYGHLRLHSIKVRPGDIVRPGEVIGLIGLSGNTEFMHLHFEIRYNGEPVDPYTGMKMGGGCGETGHPLWTEVAAAQLPYRTEAPFDAGFATGKVDFAKARAGAYAADSLSTDIPALVFWAEALGPQAGDRETIRLIDPDGSELVDATDTLEDTKVQRSRFAGVRRPESGWVAGTYRGEYIVRRGGKTIIEITREIELR